MIFTGKFRCSADKLLRILVPREFRGDALAKGGDLYVRKGKEKGYFILTTEEELQRHLDAEFPGSADDENVREGRRWLMMAIQKVHLDPQGRMKVSFMTGVAEGDGFVIVGTGRDFEMWREADWNNEYGQS